MKRILCILCTCVMLCHVLAAGLAEDVGDAVPLWEKMQRQVELGSGLQGILKMQLSGEGDAFSVLKPVEDTTFHLRYIQSGERSDAELYAEKADAEIGKTCVFSDGKAMYFVSDWLMDTALKLPLPKEWLEKLTGGESQGNPQILGQVIRLCLTSLQADAPLHTAMAGLVSGLSLRLDAYAGETGLLREQGETQMRFVYTLTPENVKTEIRYMLETILGDEQMLAALKEEMTEEQARLYLNPSYLWYLEREADGLSLTDNVVFERRVSMQGEERMAKLTLPIPGKEQTSLVFQKDGNTQTLVYASPDGTLSWDLYEGKNSANGFSGNGSVAWESADRAIHALWTLDVSTRDGQEEDGTGLEKGTVNLTVTPEEETEKPMALHVDWTLSGKPAKRAATTLEARAEVKLAEEVLTAACVLRTQSPWDLPERQAENPIDVAGMTQEEQVTLLSDFLLNGLAQLDMLGRQETADAASGEESSETRAAQEDGEDTDLPQESEADVATETDMADAGDAVTSDTDLTEEGSAQ